ncbi:50S ribosomal protein L3 [Candidatus Deianiraea vastatrix]|nr:50S ribosomal protein L3 [Candidatus Deianiraea vastatrix]
MESSFGLIGKKCGMTSLFLDDGSVIPCTAVYIDRHYIVNVKTVAKDGYNAVILGTNAKRAKLVNKPQRKNLETLNLPALSNLKEFRLPNNLDMSTFVLGSEIEIDFKHLNGSFVDVRSRSKGKGFAGVVKRYGFGGQHASHGESLSERSHGSTGQRQDPGKVFKNKKMAGHMGDENVCIQNLSVLKVLPDERMLLISGSISGHSGSDVILTSSIKMSMFGNLANGEFIFNWFKLSSFKA